MSSPFVTVLFTDMVGSTALLSLHGDDAGDRMRRDHFAVLRLLIAEHSGREVKSTGDGLMVAFASAADAVRCAAAMQKANAARDEPIGLRVGLDAGEPIEDGDDLYGTPVTTASRLCDAAKPGQVLVSDIVRQIATRRVDETFVPVGPLRLKGLADAIAASEVRWSEETPRDAEAAAVRPIRVLVVDDQQLLRAGFRVILEAEHDIEVIGEASDGLEAVELSSLRRPDVILMDIRMPRLDGLAAAERILQQPEPPRIVMLTTFDLDEYVYRALRLGVSGFLLKSTPSSRLVDAIRAASGGHALIEPSITSRLVEEFTRNATPRSTELPPELTALTERELDVLRLVARGLSNAEIAAELTVAETTVKTHVARILMKLGLRDRVQAVVVAFETGFVRRNPG